MQKESESQRCHSWPDTGPRMSCPTEEQKGWKIHPLLSRENLQEAEAHPVTQMPVFLAGKRTASVGIVV